MKIKKLLTTVLIVFTITSPILYLTEVSSFLLFDGSCGSDVTNTSSKIGNLQDTAYTYTGVDCVVYDYGIVPDDDVTIVVIDQGLSGDGWEYLEDNAVATIEIIGFLTKDENDTLKWITDPTDSYLDDQIYTNHGLMVCSVLASIARDVKIIFIDLDYSNDPYGFELDDYSLWEWIEDYQSTYDIDIISTSCSWHVDFMSQAIEQIWDNLISNGVVMLSSAGNAGNYLNYVYWDPSCYPQYYSQWYCVGSVDHETRENTSHPDIDSDKDSVSSFSSWYENNETGNHIVNWLEPGNGIPVLTLDPPDDFEWEYAWGTSFSTPYLAAIIALIITKYHDGIGSSTDPSVQKVVEILLYASSRGTFHQKQGYGYVDAYLACGKAYTEGVLAS